MNQRGTSLVELSIMIAIIPILIGVWMNGSDLRTNYADRAARKLESDLRYCQQLALSEEVNCGLQVTNNTTYNVYRQAVGNIITDPFTRNGMTMNLSTFYNGVTFGANNYQVEFNNLGKPVIGSGLQMVLNDGTVSRTVTITANTGYVQVQ